MGPFFPAILIGGPPHSGKSTLTYRLSHALRERRIPHYALRASPDGEGDWSSEAAQAVVAELRLRAKDYWTPELGEKMARDVTQRHLPLLVDAGGKVSPETEQIAAQCTHALLLAADPDALAPWRTLVEDQGLVLVADLVSDLHGTQQVQENTTLLRGVLTGLGQALSSAGPCFAALVDRVAHLCAYNGEDLYRIHLALTEVELVINLDRPIHPVPVRQPHRWETADVPVLLASLPPQQPLGIYGRGPVWLYAALAASNPPLRCVVFDIRQGWVAPPRLAGGAAPDDARLHWDAIIAHSEYTHVQFSVPGGYLDYRDAADVPVPDVGTEGGVVLDGRLPNWLWAALARHYTTAAWVAVFVPQMQQSVVVWSRDARVAPGSLV